MSLDKSSLDITTTSLKNDVEAENIARSQILRIVGANQNPTDFYKLSDSDDILRPIVNHFRGLRIPQTLSVYEGLVTAIIGQQISTSVASMLRSLIVELYGDTINIDGQTFYLFPTP